MANDNRWLVLTVFGIVVLYSSLFLLASNGSQPAGLVQGGVATQLTYMVKGDAEASVQYWLVGTALVGMAALFLGAYGLAENKLSKE
ncbi:MAG: hypothetical protein WC607_03545 [Candidatus Micrarchaeia archaeon]